MRQQLVSSLILATLVGCGGPAAETPAEAPAAPKAANEETLPNAFQPITSEGASVAFIAPAEGASVASPVAFTFDAKNVVIQKAGSAISNAGHHHLLIDIGPIAEGEVIPADASHLHYGGAQTSASVELPPGPHTLTLQLADGLHRSYGPKYSATLHITVTGGAAEATPAPAAPAAE